MVTVTITMKTKPKIVDIAELLRPSLRHPFLPPSITSTIPRSRSSSSYTLQIQKICISSAFNQIAKKQFNFKFLPWIVVRTWGSLHISSSCTLTIVIHLGIPLKSRNQSIVNFFTLSCAKLRVILSP